MGIKIISSSELESLNHIASEFNEIVKENQQLKSKVDDLNELQLKLKRKLQGTGAVVYDMQIDKEGNMSYVCVQDKRIYQYDKDRNTVFCKGDVNIFVLSPYVFPSKRDGKFTDMPFLRAEFSSDHVEIVELHSDTDGDFCENKGYGTMMVNALIRIAKESDCSLITGSLSSVDAETPEAKEKRNGFYKKRGFELSFSDETESSGSIRMRL